MIHKSYIKYNYQRFFRIAHYLKFTLKLELIPSLFQVLAHVTGPRSDPQGRHGDRGESRRCPRCREGARMALRQAKLGRTARKVSVLAVKITYI